MTRRCRGALMTVALALAGSSSAIAQTIFVDGNVATSGDGSPGAPVKTISEGLALAAAIGERSPRRIVVDVAPFAYVGSYTARAPHLEILPLAIGRNTWLRGASRPLEDCEGLPTGGVEPGTETSLRPDVPLGAGELLIWIAEDDVRVSGLVLDGVGPAPSAPSLSRGILAERARRFVVDRNVIVRVTEGVASRLSSGRVQGNHVSETTIGLLLQGGAPDLAAEVVVAGNRSTGNSLGSGIFGAPDSDAVNLGGGRTSPPITSADPMTITVAYDGNDFSANAIAGVRSYQVGGTPPAGQQRSEIDVASRANRFECNGFYGFIADSFPPAAAGGYHGSSLRATFAGDEVVGNGRNGFMLSLLRFQQAVLSTPPPVIRPLVSTTFDVAGDVARADVDYWNLERSNLLLLGGDALPYAREVHPVQSPVCRPSVCD